MRRTLTDARRWMQQGTQLLLAGVDGLGEEGYAQPSLLPSWSRKHLVAHVAANAEALGNLVLWAATGVETPMYASLEARVAGIAKGTALAAEALDAWLRTSAETLEEGVQQLNDDRWSQPVVTAQGRTVAATEIPWLRAREVCVHAVDLGRDVTFAHLPADFLLALGDDIVGKRRAAPDGPLRLEANDANGSWELAGDGDRVTIAAPLTDLVGYLSGRTTTLSTIGGTLAPALPAWL